ncbi:MAG: DUF2490 domain-containing protein [Pyrinomonadaceae bacterium]
MTLNPILTDPKDFYSTVRLITVLCCGLLAVRGAVPCRAQARPAQASQDDTQSWNEVQITVPLKKWVDLVVGGQLRLGRNVTDFVDERGGMALTFKVHKYLTLQPGYLHIATQPTPDRKAFENRLGFAATVQFPLGKFNVNDRNLFERRFRSPLNSTRYRNRLQVSRPVKLNGSDITLFASDEVFYDWSVDDWVRNRFSVGVGKRFSKNLTTDFYYMRQNDGRSRPGDLHVFGTVFRVRL